MTEYSEDSETLCKQLSTHEKNNPAFKLCFMIVIAEAGVVGVILLFFWGFVFLWTSLWVFVGDRASITLCVVTPVLALKNSQRSVRMNIFFSKENEKLVFPTNKIK